MNASVIVFHDEEAYRSKGKCVFKSTLWLIHRISGVESECFQLNHVCVHVCVKIVLQTELWSETLPWYDKKDLLFHCRSIRICNNCYCSYLFCAVCQQWLSWILNIELERGIESLHVLTDFICSLTFTHFI